tara:strand:+ start:284 stop:583 length:300 start_codon:yes stop_codon:yes gene_type:complete
MLLFELTRGEELIMPLLAAAGTGPVVYDAIERRLAAFGSRPATTKPAGTAAGDEAGQVGSGQRGDDGCEVDMPAVGDVDNGMVCRPEASHFESARQRGY